MPAFDFPLEQLRTYGGRNPRPDDFDEFWLDALDELDHVHSHVGMEPVDHVSPVAECFNLTFTGVRDARLYAKYLRPARAAEAHPGVAIFHGYSMSSPDWFDLLPYVAQGYSVMALDCRGQGGRSEDPGGPPGNTLNGHIVRGLGSAAVDLLYRQIFLDCVQTVRILMDMAGVDSSRIGVKGGSQGGGLALACAGLEPRIKAAAIVFPFLCDYLRVWEMDLAENAYGELRQYIRRFDPNHQDISSLFARLGYIDAQHHCPQIKARVLFTTGLMDQVCPPSTQFAAYNKITSPKELVIYPDYEHEFLPGNSDRILEFLDNAL